MKRILSMLLCLLLLCSAVSCGGTDPYTESGENGAPQGDLQGSSDYKHAYLEFLKDKQDDRRLFALVFIDNDDIPELYVRGAFEAEGDMICSFKNGAVVSAYLNRTGGGMYIERSGDVINRNGTNGCYETDVYQLTADGFAKTFYAASREIVEETNGEFHSFFEYSVADVPVSEEEYRNAVNAAFDFSRAIDPVERAVSYNEIVLQLQNGNLNAT